MTLYLFSLLLLLLVSCFDVSFSQRKLPKQSVVTVDVKTAVHFDCPEEFGYYPHPDDCTQYYVCVFGGALLESCTGGLMYSQELQTCDWPRNVGCDGVEIAPTPTNPTSSSNGRSKEEYTRTRYTPPPPPKPSALVISRGQPRQQQIYRDEEINLKQQQLYQDSEETLPEAQEEESDRQQRFYRGQPSTIGQVQRDRDGLRQSNAIAYHSGQKEKIGVISFGIHQAQEHQRDKGNFHLENLTDNKLTLTRRRKRQIGASPISSSFAGAPRSWSSLHTSNKQAFRPLQLHHPTGPDTPLHLERIIHDYKGTTDRNYFPTYTPRQTLYNNNPRNRNPSRYLDDKFVNINQYNRNTFKPITPLYDSVRENYYSFNLDGRNNDTSVGLEKIKLKYIKPAGFELISNTHTDAITKGFETRHSNGNTSPKNNLYHQELNPYISTPNFHKSRNYSAAGYVSTFHNVDKPELYDPSLKFHRPSNNSKTNFLPRTTLRTNEETQKQNYEITTQRLSSQQKEPFDYDLNYYYDEDTESIPNQVTTQTISERTTIQNSTTSYKQNQNNKLKFPEHNAKETHNNPKKNTKYSSKYKEGGSTRKTATTKKPIKENPLSSIPKPFFTPPPRNTQSEGIHKHFTESTITETITRSRIRQSTTLPRGKHKHTNGHNLRKNVVNANHRAETTTAAPEPISVTARTLLNTSQYSASSYAPYEPEYEDKVKYEYNSYNDPPPSAAPVSFRSRTQAPTYQSSLDDIHPSKRTNVIQNDYVRGVYQEQSLPDYHDVTYENAEDDHNSYRQSNRQPVREDKKESNLIEDQPSSSKSRNRIAATYPSSTSRYSTKKTVKTPTPTISYKKNLVTSSATNENKSNQYQYLVPGDTNPYTLSRATHTKNTTDTTQLSLLKSTNNDNDISPTFHKSEILKPVSFYSLRTEQQIPATYRFITKKPPSKSTDHVSLSGTRPTQFDSFDSENLFTSPTTSSTYQPPSIKSVVDYDVSFINPTTYSPPRLYFQSFLAKRRYSSSIPLKSDMANNYARNFTISQTNKPANSQYNPLESYLTKSNKVGKFIKEFVPINPIQLNQQLLVTNYSGESIEEELSSAVVANSTDIIPSESTENRSTKSNIKLLNESEILEDVTSSTITTSSVETFTKTKFESLTNPPVSIQDQFVLKKKIRYSNFGPSYNNPFQNTKILVVPPPSKSLTDQNKVEDEPDILVTPTFKLKPFNKLTKKSQNKTEISMSTTTPRISRINPAFKFMMNSFRGTKGNNTKCKESTSIPNCSDFKQLRTNNRPRGSQHYTTGNVVTNDVTVNVNRGTPPPRSRPTLKPSTSIVSKAQEFVDIYRYPPRRPDPIYPQPQPDKTAAKCRKDVCLLPDCSCGGKEIPGDIPADQVPQIVLLTFDDSVNDLNKGLYQDLFERGRVNPNGCPISATFYVSHEWTDYSQVQNLYSDGHELASHTVSHSFGEQFSQKKWTREIAGQREILAAYGGVHLEDVRGMRAPFLSVGGNKMFKMLYDSNFTYDSSMPIYENKPPSWPYTLDYKLFHDCMIPPCPTRSYPGVWEVPMVMWQDLNGGRCSMGDACSNPADAEGVHKMIMKNFQRHYTTNRAPFGLFYHAAWFTQPHHKEGFINFLDSILEMRDVWVLTNWQAVQWVRDPTPTSRLGSFKPFQCDYSDRPKRCNNPKVCNLWHKSGVRYMRTCQPCPDIYPWTGNSGIRSSRIDNDIED